MFEWRQAKRGGRFLSLSGALLLAAALALCAVQAAAAEEAVSDPKTAPCKGLKPYNNLDELLYQFYINLDSDCLFKMPVEELEKIWGIKILNEERANPETYSTFSELEFYDKPYKSEKDAFFVGTFRGKDNTNVFWVNITKKYFEKYATLFPDGNFPKLIPEPLKKSYVWRPSIRPSGHPFRMPEKPRNQGVYRMTNYKYYWLNSNRTSMIYLRGIYGVTGVTIQNQVSESYQVIHQTTLF